MATVEWIPQTEGSAGGEEEESNKKRLVECNITEDVLALVNHVEPSSSSNGSLPFR